MRRLTTAVVSLALLVPLPGCKDPGATVGLAVGVVGTVAAVSALVMGQRKQRAEDLEAEAMLRQEGYQVDETPAYEGPYGMRPGYPKPVPVQ